MTAIDVEQATEALNLTSTGRTDRQTDSYRHINKHTYQGRQINIQSTR